jgi:hypothetical protein
MSITYRQTEGTQAERPKEVEVGLTTVYLRKNIESSIKKQDGGDIQVWNYEEARLMPEEYKAYLGEMENPAIESIMQNISDIQAEQELLSIDNEINSVMIMQTLSNLQADIALMSIE